MNLVDDELLTEWFSKHFYDKAPEDFTIQSLNPSSHYLSNFWNIFLMNIHFSLIVTKLQFKCLCSIFTISYLFDKIGIVVSMSHANFFLTQERSTIEYITLLICSESLWDRSLIIEHNFGVRRVIFLAEKAQSGSRRMHFQISFYCIL